MSRIDPAKLATADQVASAVASTTDGGTRALDVRVWGGIDVRLLPDRGLDIGAAWFLGVPLAWLSGRGEPAPLPADELVGERWSDAWGGGLVTTCGLSNVGAPSEGHGLHGSYSHRPAADVEVRRTDEAIAVSAVIDDPPFRVERVVSTAVGSGVVRIDDATVNTSEWTAAAPLLYHVNVGAPLWDGDAWLQTDATEVVPRDEDAAAALDAWDVPPEPSAGAPERVFEHVGATWARLTSRGAGVELVVRSSLPRLWQWVQPAAGVYALGVEPANCSVLGRDADLESGRMPFLDPGETRESWLTVEARSAG
jgi:hypothetical protein